MSLTLSQLPTQRLQLDQDPFDDEDDAIFASVRLEDLQDFEPPPPKRLRSSQVPGSQDLDSEGLPTPFQHKIGTSNAPSQADPFTSDLDDEHMCQIADALEGMSEEMFADDEMGWSDESEGQEVGCVIRKPHPLLIPHIYEKILSHLNTPNSLLSARQVCTSWNEVIQEKTFKVATLRNLSHVIQRFPYGLGAVETEDRYAAPMKIPVLTRLRIADPCKVLSSSEVDKYFTTYGRHIKYIGLDANMYCKQHWMILRRILVDWCTELEELELVDVTCLDALIIYSELYNGRSFKLKKLKVTCKTELTRDHHHFSTIKTVRFHQRHYMVNRFSCRRDGGLISRILSISPNLKEFSFHFNFSTVAAYFMNFRISDVNFGNLDVLELLGVDGLGIDRRDVRILRACGFHLRNLVMGPISTQITAIPLEGFLRDQASTLEHLELHRVTPQPTPTTERLVTVTFTLPELPILKTLKIKGFTSYGIGNLDQIYRTPGLNTLELTTEHVPNQLREQAEYNITTMFAGEYVNEHLCLRNLSLTGPYTESINHTEAGHVLRTIAPKLETLSVCTTGANLPDCLNAYSELVQLKTMSLSIKEAESFGQVSNVLKQAYQSLRNLTVTVTGHVPIRPEHVDEFKSLTHLTLDGFLLHDTESKSVATHLAKSVNYTTLKNCKLVKAGNAKVYGYVGKLTKPLDDITLTLVNLPSLLEDVFKAI